MEERGFAYAHGAADQHGTLGNVTIWGISIDTIKQSKNFLVARRVALIFILFSGLNGELSEPDKERIENLFRQDRLPAGFASAYNTGWELHTVHGAWQSAFDALMIDPDAPLPSAPIFAPNSAASLRFHPGSRGFCHRRRCLRYALEKPGQGIAVGAAKDAKVAGGEWRFEEASGYGTLIALVLVRADGLSRESCTQS